MRSTTVTERMQINETAKCLRCEYPLRGLSEPICPECGLQFDPTDPRTYDVGRAGRLAGHLSGPPPLWHLAAASVAVVHLYLLSTPGDGRATVVYGNAVTAFGKWVLFLAAIDYVARLASLISLKVRMRGLKSFRRSRRWRWCVIPAGLALWFAAGVDAWPLRARFWFGRDAMERTARATLSGTAPPRGSAWYGLYPIRQVVEIDQGINPGVHFVTGGISGRAAFVYRPYCCPAGRHQLVFDDDGTANVPTLCRYRNACAKQAVRVRPSESLDAFDGVDGFGDWTLSVGDAESGVAGNLLDWALIPSARRSEPVLAIGNLDGWGAVDEIMYAADIPISSLYIHVVISHPKLKNLIGRLTHVDTGRSVTLFDFQARRKPRIVVSPDDDTQVVGGRLEMTLDDHGRYPVEYAVVPYIVTLDDLSVQPTEPLRGFVGDTLKGNWELSIVDREKASTVQIHEWTMYPNVMAETCGAPIPNGGPAPLTTVISDETHAEIRDLDVAVNLMHAAVSSLRVSLAHAPSGITVELMVDANAGVSYSDEFVRHWSIQR